MIRVIITENIEGEFQKVKRFTANGRSGEVISNREHFQNYGFTSRPKPGAEGIVFEQGSSFVLIATDDRRYRFKLGADGEVAIYTDEGDRIHFKRNREIEVVSNKVVVNANTVELGGNSLTKKLIDERILSALNLHYHAVAGASTGPVIGTLGELPPGTPATFSAVAHATANTKAK